MQPARTESDDDIRRWWLGGAPAAGEPEASALEGPDADDALAHGAPPAAAPAHDRRAREGWWAAAGGAAAAVLLAAFYGVVDDAAARGPAAWQAQAAAAAQAEPLQADAGAAEVDTMHAVYTLPPAGDAPRYTRWP